MASYGLSPNEMARLVNEEKNRLKIQRLKQVREQAKAHSTKLRKNVLEEKKRLLRLAEAEVKKRWEEDHSKEVWQAEKNLKATFMEIGDGHRNAAELNIDLLNEQKAFQESENQCNALKRQREALMYLREEKESQESENVQRLVDRSSALDMEKTRAAIVASLPKPKPKSELQVTQPKPRTYARTIPKTGVIVEKEDSNSCAPIRSALEEAAIYEQKYESLEEKKQRIIKERREKALTRHEEALDREYLRKEQQNVAKELIDIRNEEISARKSEVEKTSKWALTNNLKQKENAKKDELTSGVLQFPQSNGSTELSSGSHGTLEHDDSTPLLSNNLAGDLGNHDSCRLSEAGSETNEGFNKDEANEDHSMMAPVQPDKTEHHPLGFEFNEHARRRLLDLVERQQLGTKKKDAALQVNINFCQSLPNAKHQCIQVAVEELKNQDIELKKSGSLKGQDIVEIRKKKQELINELMAIEAMKNMLETPNYATSVQNRTQVKNDTKKWTETHLPNDMSDSNIKTVQTENESILSSHSSTQYLQFPPYTGIIMQSTQPDSECVSDLHEHKPSQLGLEEIMPQLETSSHAHHAQSLDCSNDTMYLDAPTYKNQNTLDAAVHSFAHSSFKELPSFSCDTNTTVSNLEGTVRNLRTSFGDERNGQITQLNEPSDTSSDQNKFSVEDINNSRTILNVTDDLQKWSRPEHNSFSSSNMSELLDQDSTVLKSVSAIDLVSERASVISLDIHNSGTESMSSYDQDSLITSSLQRRFLELFLPCNIPRSPEGTHSITSGQSDIILDSEQSIHIFQDADSLNISHAVNSTIDIISERASRLSVELSDYETVSFRPISRQNISESKVFQAQHCNKLPLEYKLYGDSSRITMESSRNSSIISNNSNSSNTLYKQSDRSGDNETSKESQTPRNWLRILEPYKEKSQACPIKQYTDDNSTDECTSLEESCQIGDGILEEPDLTLVSANTTMSVAGDSLRNSGLQSSSLLSFERHEINFLHHSSEQCAELPSPAAIQTTTIPQPGIHALVRYEAPSQSDSKPPCNLMYPRKNDIQNIFKETMNSWKDSRASMARHDSTSNRSGKIGSNR